MRAACLLVLSSSFCLPQAISSSAVPSNTGNSIQGFACTLTMERETWNPGEELSVTIRLTNETERPVDTIIASTFEFKNQLADWISRTESEKGSQPKNAMPGTLPGHIHLQPGSNARLRVDLHRMKWGAIQASTLPSANLESIPPGPYVLTVHLRGKEGSEVTCSHSRVDLKTRARSK